jgi:hypothetical protein
LGKDGGDSRRTNNETMPFMSAAGRTPGGTLPTLRTADQRPE